MENYSRIIELELIIHQKDYELSVKDAALAVKNKELEEKNNMIKQLTEKLQQLQDRFDTLRSFSRVDCDTVMELRDKLRVKDDKIEELSTKLAEVVVGNKKHDVEVAYWKDVIDRKNEYMDELHEQLEDLESIIEGQKKQIADLENKLKDRLSPTSDKAASKGPDKMSDYEGFRRAVEDMCEAKDIWEAFFNE